MHSLIILRAVFAAHLTLLLRPTHRDVCQPFLLWLIVCVN